MENIEKEFEYDLTVFTAKPKNCKYSNQEEQDRTLNNFIINTIDDILVEDEEAETTGKQDFYKLENDVLNIELVELIRHLINETVATEDNNKGYVVDYLIEYEIDKAERLEMYELINRISTINRVKGYITGIIDTVKAIHPTCKINLIY